MDSNFYSTEVDMEINFQRNSTQAPHTTSPSSAHFHHGSLRRIPSRDPENVEGFPIFLH